MNKHIWMSFVAALTGLAIVIAWSYINFKEHWWESGLIFLFGNQQGWLLMLAGIPLFVVIDSSIDSFVTDEHKVEKLGKIDCANLALHAAILKNQEERLAPLIKEKEAMNARERTLQTRETVIANKESSVIRIANLEKKFEESKLNNRLLKQENNALKDENAHLKK